MELISISDLHIGNNQLSPEITYRNIKKYLYPELNEKLDMLIFVGDFFHTLLHLNSPAAYVAITIIDEILELSNKYGFLVRVVDGTFEHDRDMNKLFLRHPEKYPNVKVMNTMGVEYVEEKGIYVLYIPDDLPYKNAQSEAIMRIKEFGISKVDVIALHGYCKHEIPKDVPIEPYNLFNIDQLSKYVKGPIIKGHIHSKSIYSKCLNNGSFERFRHNEEERKGYYRITYDMKDSFTYKFICNEDTGLFKSITLPDENFIEVFVTQMEKIKSKINELTPLPINIRLICKKAVKNKFNPHDFDFDLAIKYTFKLLDSLTIYDEKDDFYINVNDLAPITKDNLPELIASFIDNKLSIQEVKEILNQEE